MAITGSIDLGNGKRCLTISHDPTSVATDAPAGAFFIDANGDWWRKTDNGSTVNVVPVADTVAVLQDQDSAVQADIEADGGKGALFVQSMSLAQIVDDAVKAVAATPDKVAVLGGIAETTVPTAQADGKVVALRMDEYGGLWVKGYDAAQGALGVSDVSPALLQTFAETLLNAVTGTGASATKTGLDYHELTFHTIVTGAPAVGTMVIQTSLDGTNWDDAVTHTIAAAGLYEAKLQGKFKYVRANLTARTSGTYTVLMLLGN